MKHIHFKNKKFIFLILFLAFFSIFLSFKKQSVQALKIYTNMESYGYGIYLGQNSAIDIPVININVRRGATGADMPLFVSTKTTKEWMSFSNAASSLDFLMCGKTSFSIVNGNYQPIFTACIIECGYGYGKNITDDCIPIPCTYSDYNWTDNGVCDGTAKKYNQSIGSAKATNPITCFGTVTSPSVGTGADCTAFYCTANQTNSAYCSTYGTRTCNTTNKVYTNNCTCNTGYTNATCNGCATNYIGYPTCILRTCTEADYTWADSAVCDSTGKLIQNRGTKTGTCTDMASTTRVGTTACSYCTANQTNSSYCSTYGTRSCNTTNKVYTNTCTCNTGYTGATCNSCNGPDYVGTYPSCVLRTCVYSDYNWTDNAICDGTTKRFNQVIGSKIAGKNCSGTPTSPSVGTGTDCSGTYCAANQTNSAYCSNYGTRVCDTTNNVYTGCTCNTGYTGATCSGCATNYIGYPTCILRTCTEADYNWTDSLIENVVCDPTGKIIQNRGSKTGTCTDLSYTTRIGTTSCVYCTAGEGNSAYCSSHGTRACNITNHVYTNACSCNTDYSGSVCETLRNCNDDAVDYTAWTNTTCADLTSDLWNQTRTRTATNCVDIQSKSRQSGSCNYCSANGGDTNHSYCSSVGTYNYTCVNNNKNYTTCSCNNAYMTSPNCPTCITDYVNYPNCILRTCTEADYTWTNNNICTSSNVIQQTRGAKIAGRNCTDLSYTTRNGSTGCPYCGNVTGMCGAWSGSTSCVCNWGQSCAVNCGSEAGKNGACGFLCCQCKLYQTKVCSSLYNCQGCVYQSTWVVPTCTSSDCVSKPVYADPVYPTAFANCPRIYNNTYVSCSAGCDEGGPDAPADVPEPPADATEPSSGGCFTSDTLVKTTDGNKEIEDIKEGDYVISFDTYKNKEVESKVEELLIHDYLKNEYYEIKTKNSFVKVNEVHPFYIGNNMYKKVMDLKVGDTVYVLKDGKLVKDIILEKNLVKLDYIMPYIYNLKLEGDTQTYSAGGYLVHTGDNYMDFNGEMVAKL